MARVLWKVEARLHRGNHQKMLHLSLAQQVLKRVACVRVCVCACVRACVRACLLACVRGWVGGWVCVCGPPVPKGFCGCAFLSLLESAATALDDLAWSN